MTTSASKAGRPPAADGTLAQRDLDGLVFTGEMYGVQLDQLAALLALTEERARAVGARWRARGYADTARLCPGRPWIWLGEAPPWYGLQKAQRALSYIAVRMNQDGTRDLAWWRIPAWASRVPRVIATGLAFGLVVGLVVGLAFGLVAGLAAVLLAGLAAWRGSKSPQRLALARWRQVLRPSSLRFGLATGLVLVLVAGLLAGFVVELVAALLAGLVAGFGGCTRPRRLAAGCGQR